MPLPDPMIGLRSFSQVHAQGGLTLRQGDLDPDVYVYLDRPEGQLRFTYARLHGGTVIATAILGQAEPVDGVPCFDVHYAVMPEHRGQGVATELVRSAISELTNGFVRNGVRDLYFEAIVGAENEASQRVAMKTIAAEGEEAIDEEAEVPVVQFLGRFTN